jgi:hypothetical protein
MEAESALTQVPLFCLIAALFLKKAVHADFIVKLASGHIVAPRTPPIMYFPE